MEETGPNSYLVHCVVSKTIYDFILELQEIDTCLTQTDWRSIDLPESPCILSLLSRFYNLEVVVMTINSLEANSSDVEVSEDELIKIQPTCILSSHF